MSRYELTAHAETVLAERAITREWLDLALHDPERTEADKNDADLKHALRRIPEHGDRVLRVVYNDSVNPLRVVTAYFDRTMRGRL